MSDKFPPIPTGFSLDTRESLLDLIVAVERDKAKKLLNEIASIYGYRSAIDTILQPVLVMLGELWSRDDITLAQGYVASKVSEDILESAMADPLFNSGISTLASVAVIGNIEDDFHAFGRKLVTTFLKLAGWEVHDLGCDVTAPEFLDKALETGARVIGVSSMIYTTAENIRRVRREIDQRNLTGQIMLAVGGAVFNYRHELVQQVGGDGTSRNAMSAPALFDALAASSITHTDKSCPLNPYDSTAARRSADQAGGQP